MSGSLPRDVTCWYCQREQHSRCSLPKTCACRTCYGQKMKHMRTRTDVRTEDHAAGFLADLRACGITLRVDHGKLMVREARPHRPP